MKTNLALKSTRTKNKKLSNSKSFDLDMQPYSMKTSIAGRIKNFGDFKGNAYLPVFEAFVNSIHAIEDYKEFYDNPNYQGEIKIRVNRGAGQSNATDGKVERKNKDIISFEIEDNGIGFNERNFESFLTSESDYKLARGGKGIGRFSWLKAFERAEIKSIYTDENNVRKQREFTFSLSGINETYHDVINPEIPNKTIVKLIDFKRKYRDLESAWKRPKTIAERTLSHCFFIILKISHPK